MATLTNADFTAYKRALYRNPAWRQEVHDADLSKQSWKDTFQALEDGYTTRRVDIKGEMDTASGITLTNALAKAMEDVWMKNKAGL